MTKIAVTSNSFSFNAELTSNLKSHFPDISLKKNKERLSGTDLIQYLSDCEGAIVGLEKIDENIIKNLPKLKIVSKFGVGLDNLDLEALKKHNISVGWTPGVNKSSVSELALGNMISLARNVFVTSNQLRSDIWNKNGGRELSELTIGVIGIGHIGKDLIQKLIPFGCEILANDIIDQSNFLSPLGIKQVELEEVFKRADVITIHTPKTFETTNLFNKDIFSKMKKDSMIISTARGGIVNENDLYDAIDSGHLHGAALDVFEIEPSIKNRLYSLPNFIGTPHLAGNSRKAVLSMGNSAIDHLVNFFK